MFIGLSFFTFYSDSAFTESGENNTTSPFSATPGETETVYISINQVNPTAPENQNILEQAAYVTTNESPLEIHLENTVHAVKTVEMEVCDEDDYLTLSTCVTTDRTAGFLCRASESSNGCCTIRLFPMFPNLTIAEGSGPIFLLNYNVSEEAPSDECRNIDTENSVVTDPDGTLLEAIVSPGEYCFSAEPASCEVTISPAVPDIVLSGDSIAFSGHTSGTGCEPSSCYMWDVTGESDATIDDTGWYVAGSAGGRDVVNFIDTCNGYTTASAEVIVLQDSDRDGIPDVEDADCPESNFEATVTIDGCETTVENHLVDNGCTMSDLIAQCAAEKNHGLFVFCVTRYTLEWKKDNLLSFRNMGSIIRCAARADLP